MFMCVCVRPLGVPFTSSDHSPVFCTFLLRIENYQIRIKQQNMFSLWQRKEEALCRNSTRSALLSKESNVDMVSDIDAPAWGSRSVLGTAVPHSGPAAGDASRTRTHLLTISDLSLICGSSELNPCGLRLVFPQPFEVRRTKRSLPRLASPRRA
jgi:hypothetical protein